MSRTTAACRVAIAEQAQSFVFLLKGTNRAEEICSLVTSSKRGGLKRSTQHLREARRQDVTG